MPKRIPSAALWDRAPIRRQAFSTRPTICSRRPSTPTTRHAAATERRPRRMSTTRPAPPSSARIPASSRAPMPAPTICGPATTSLSPAARRILSRAGPFSRCALRWSSRFAPSCARGPRRAISRSRRWTAPARCALPTSPSTTSRTARAAQIFMPSTTSPARSPPNSRPLPFRRWPTTRRSRRPRASSF